MTFNFSKHSPERFFMMAICSSNGTDSPVEIKIPINDQNEYNKYTNSPIVVATQCQNLSPDCRCTFRNPDSETRCPQLPV